METRELPESPATVVRLDSVDQPDGALLVEVGKAQAAVAVLVRLGHDEVEVVLDEALAGMRIAPVCEEVVFNLCSQARELARLGAQCGLSLAAAGRRTARMIPASRAR